MLTWEFIHDLNILEIQGAPTKHTYATSMDHQPPPPLFESGSSGLTQ